MLRLSRLIRSHPWKFAAFSASAAIEVMLAFLWLQDRDRDWAEPALVLFGILMVTFGLPRELPSIDEEHKAAEAAVTYLEGKGLCFESYAYETPKACHRSADKMRVAITRIMERAPHESEVSAKLNTIRLGCLQFMRTLEGAKIQSKQSLYDLNSEQREEFIQALHRFREVSGGAVAAIASKYDLKVRWPLARMVEPHLHKKRPTRPLKRTPGGAA